jgi:hypothetical protein
LNQLLAGNSNASIPKQSRITKAEFDRMSHKQQLAVPLCLYDFPKPKRLEDALMPHHYQNHAVWQLVIADKAIDKRAKRKQFLDLAKAILVVRASANKSTVQEVRQRGLIGKFKIDKWWVETN